MLQKQDIYNMNNYNNRRFLVIPVSEIPNINFNEIEETSAETLRFSLDGTKTFVKYNVNVVEEDYEQVILDPETNIEKTITTKAGIYGRPSIYKEEYNEYLYEEILNVLNTDEWLHKNTI